MGNTLGLVEDSQGLVCTEGLRAEAQQLCQGMVGKTEGRKGDSRSSG